MELFCNTTLTLVFGGISAIHFYWAFGGKRGKQAALPITKTGTPLFEPGFWACAIVGCAFAGLLAFVNFGYLFFRQKHTILSVLIAVAFFFRAVGDFNYVGFFKKVKNTGFAKRDDKYYVPLCLLVCAVVVLKWLT